MRRFFRIAKEQSAFAACCGIREPLLRWPLLTMVWLIEAPGYFWGAWRADRFSDPEFWSFTAAIYRASMVGSFVEFYD